jgi:hypothetical protein
MTPNHQEPLVRTAVRIAAILAAAALLGACAAKPAAESEKPAAPSAETSSPVKAPESVDPTTGAFPSTGLAALTPSQKKASIHKSFPAEVPVPQGKSVKGKAQGEAAWDYQLKVDASVEAVAAWYAERYRSAGWVTVAENYLDTPKGPGYSLEFAKGDAKSTVTLSQVGASTTLAVVTVGFGGSTDTQ